MNKREDLIQAFNQFMTNYAQDLMKSGDSQYQADEDWPSPCEYQREGQSCWQPVLQDEAGVTQPLSFKNVEEALDIHLDEQFTTFFTLYFANNLQAQHPLGELELLQPWSESDFSRLQQNLIGHLMMKQKLKQSPTLFFALTDEEDLNLVVDNETGAVCLEYVGKPPHKTIAEDLAYFISQCQPALFNE